MSTRRTQVTVDCVIGQVRFSGGPVNIPAQINLPQWGPWGGGGRNSIFANIAGMFGFRNLSMQLGNLQGLINGLRGMSPQAIAGVAGIAAAGAALYLHMKIVIGAVKGLWAAGKAVFQTLAQGTEAAANGFVELTQAIISASVEGLQMFGEAVVGAVEWLGETIGKVVTEGVKAFSEFEQAVASTVAVMGQFGQAGLAARERVSDLAMEMGGRSRFSAIELAQSMQEVAKAGYESEQALAYVTNAGRILAEAALEPVNVSTEVLIRTLNQYSMGAEQSMRVTNALVAAANKSITSVQGLAEALKYAGPSANMFRISLEQTLAALMGMAQQGSIGSMGGTQLTQMFNALLKQTDKAKAAFRSLGLDLTKITPLRMDIIQIVQWFEQLGNRVGRVKLMELMGKAFEVRALRGFNALLNVGSAQLRRMQASITGTNEALRVQQDQLNTIQGAWALLRNLWTNVEMLIVRGPFAEGLRAIIDSLRGVVDYAQRLGIFQQLGQVLRSFAMIVVYIIGQLGGPVVDAISGVLSSIAGVVQQVYEAVRTVLPEIIAFIGELPGLFGNALTTLLPKFLALFTTLVPLLLDFARTVLPLMAQGIATFVQVITTFLAANGQDLIAWFELLLQGVLGLVQRIPEFVPVIEQLIDLFLQWAPTVMEFALWLLPMLAQSLLDLMPTFGALAGQIPNLVSVLTSLVVILQQYGLPILQSWAGILIQLLTLLAYNWPTISQMMVSGLNAISWGIYRVALWLRSLGAPGGAVTQFLQLIRQYWPQVLGIAVSGVITLIDTLRGLSPVVVMFAGGFWLVVEVLKIVLTVIGDVYLALYALIRLLVAGAAALEVGWKKAFDAALEDISATADGISATWDRLGLTQKIVVGGAVGLRKAAQSDEFKDLRERARQWGQDVGAEGVRQVPETQAEANRQAALPPREFNVNVDLGDGVRQVVRLVYDERLNTYQERGRLNGAMA